MINLEWLRTFRTVYKTKSLSKASKSLSISQPTVSQQLAMLEAHIGKKLFQRKSKGVLETDDGRMLNTLISGSIESLEEVENQITKQKTKLKTIITIGISLHLYKSMLSQRILDFGDYVHIRFADKKTLISEVEEGKLLYAIIPDEIHTFDTICHPLFNQEIILVGTNDVDLKNIRRIYKSDMDQAERMLVNQTWYAHDRNSSFIKIYWERVFDKKRPAIIPNYVIPNEFEALFQLSLGSGMSIALKINADSFLKDKTLKTWNLAPVNFRKISLIANKKRANKQTTKNILSTFV